jgi:hypothetical protein
MTVSVSEQYSIEDRMINEYGPFGEMKIWRETRNTASKSPVALFCTLKFPHQGSNSVLDGGKSARPLSRENKDL